MKEMMKTFVLFALLLQLCLSWKKEKGETVGQPGEPREPIPGDILQFDRKLPCTDKSLYSHYAIFVGKSANIDGKKPDEDIFEMTKVDGESGCRFGKLQGPYKVFNYKDDDLRPKTFEEIKAAIPDVKKCGPWKLKNTCEDVATSLRYGEVNRQCNQLGTLAQPVCTLINKTSKIMAKLRGRRSKYLRTVADAAADAAAAAAA